MLLTETIYLIEIYFPSCFVKYLSVRFQVLTVSSMKMAVFLFTAPCILADVDRRFRGVYCHHHQGDHLSNTRLHGAVFQKAVIQIQIRFKIIIQTYILLKYLKSMLGSILDRIIFHPDDHSGRTNNGIVYSNLTQRTDEFPRYFVLCWAVWVEALQRPHLSLRHSYQTSRTGLKSCKFWSSSRHLGTISTLKNVSSSYKVMAGLYCTVREKWVAPEKKSEEQGGHDTVGKTKQT
jgi:hypothetical protein